MNTGNNIMKVFITGGSGFIGSYISSYLLENGYSVSATGTSSAHKLQDHNSFQYIRSDTTRKGEWQDSVNEADIIINLAGRNIFRPWTKKYKEQIYNSRILTTRNLVEALPEKKNTVLCNASAIGYYGDKGEESIYEDSTAGKDFLAKVCIDWENEVLKADDKGARVVIMRFGVVLGKNGGALSKMAPLYKMCLGGPLGSCLQWFPWIHMDDLVSALFFAIGKKSFKGKANFCSPNPVQNRFFSKKFGKSIKRPSFFNVPSPIIKIAAGELGTSLMASQKSYPGKLLEAGFKFQYPDIEDALLQVAGESE